MARGGRADAHKTERVAAITAAGLEAVASEALPAKQREALELLAGSPTGIPTAALASRGVAAGAVSRLVRRGYVSVRQDRVDRDPFKVSDTSPTRVGDVSDTPRTPLGDVSDTCQTGVRHVSDTGQSDTGQPGHVPDAERQLTLEQPPPSTDCVQSRGPASFASPSSTASPAAARPRFYLRLAAVTRDSGRRVLMLVPEIAR